MLPFDEQNNLDSDTNRQDRRFSPDINPLIGGPESQAFSAEASSNPKTDASSDIHSTTAPHSNATRSETAASSSPENRSPSDPLGINASSQANSAGHASNRDASSSIVDFSVRTYGEQASMGHSESLNRGTTLTGPTVSPDRTEKNLHRHAPASSSFLGNLFWMMCCGAFIVGLWQLGPLVAERYQFAMTRGKLKAEYENATTLLAGDPLANVSISSQLVAHKIRPSVVSIECTKVTEGFDPRRGRIFGQGQGSGVVISSDGYIVTNYHVIENAFEDGSSPGIIVRLANHFVYPAKIVGTDELTDLAVLKIEETDLIAANWGESDDLAVGSMVWAVGSPFGFEQTVTAGIVSGKNRLTTDTRRGTSNQLQDLLQTDAAVNPGNSGGPLVDSQGNVVGINTAILGETYQGISFAVPSAVAKFVSEQLIANGVVKRGFFGFIPASVNQRLIRDLKLTDLSGAMVVTVQPGTPASEAGLQTADVIRTWNGKQIENYNQVFNYIAVTPPNTTVKVEVIRDGLVRELTVKVGERSER